MAATRKDVPRVRVSVVDGISQRQTTEDLYLPTDWASRLVAAAIARKFEHQLADGAGNAYEYRFSYEGRYIGPDETLAQAGVRAGGSLVLTYTPTAAA